MYNKYLQEDKAMELRLLRYFLTVAKVQCFTKAALFEAGRKFRLQMKEFFLIIFCQWGKNNFMG